ncbi:cysteine peptidase family C39 domain-containing protein [Acinetobacter schindleri]|uniref:cysteine peptidase family C39 domain-containing protein n=1 Tax=Acinetobacter schindleri TaxID=108981 RepID=UPI0034D64B80
MSIKVKRIIQEDSTGCGLACVAMITNLTYSEVKKEAIKRSIIKPSKSFYTTSNNLIRLLSILDVQAKKGRAVKKWESIKSLSIVAINFREKSNTWHWVVYVPDTNIGYVLDPNKKIKTEKRVDLSRMALRSYIPIVV